MREIHIHSGLVYIRDSGGPSLYEDTVENFTVDCPITGWQLPDGASELYYMPGDRHYCMFGKQEKTYPLPWVVGDQILAAEADIIDAFDRRAAAQQQQRDNTTIDT